MVRRTVGTGQEWREGQGPDPGGTLSHLIALNKGGTCIKEGRLDSGREGQQEDWRPHFRQKRSLCRDPRSESWCQVGEQGALGKRHGGPGDVAGQWGLTRLLREEGTSQLQLRSGPGSCWKMNTGVVVVNRTAEAWQLASRCATVHVSVRPVSSSRPTPTGT